MIRVTAKMLADIESLLVIQSPFDEALAKTASALARGIEQVRAATAAIFENLEEYAWKAGMYRRLQMVPSIAPPLRPHRGPGPGEGTTIRGLCLANGGF